MDDAEALYKAVSYTHLDVYKRQDEKVIQNFPLHGKPISLHVRRRRWCGKIQEIILNRARYENFNVESVSYTQLFSLE